MQEGVSVHVSVLKDRAPPTLQEEILQHWVASSCRVHGVFSRNRFKMDEPDGLWIWKDPITCRARTSIWVDILCLATAEFE